MTSPQQPQANPTDTSVKTSVTVETTREHAFAVFTERFDTWWPRSHYNGTGELAEAVLEPRAGGRWYARGTDGSVGEWGSVLAWEPPSRLLLGWQLDADFHYDAGLVTEVEVTFSELGPHRTLVELEHRNLDRYGPAATEMRDTFGSDSGWTGMLRIFGDLATDSTADQTAG
jgi:uncharacterized protein YndB with AHSA1/START domain